MGGKSASTTSNVTETTSIVDSYNTTSNWAQNITGSGNTTTITSIGGESASALSEAFTGLTSGASGSLAKWAPMVLSAVGLLVFLFWMRKG